MVYTYLLFSYVVLLAAAILGYRGSEPSLAVILLATLLTLPAVIRARGERTLALTATVSAVNALLFVAASYGIGRGIAWLALA
jgi:hypothetical protein